MPPIRKGDGTPVAPKGISQVRTGDGRILFDGVAIPDSDIAQFEDGSLHPSFTGDTSAYEVNSDQSISGSHSLENTQTDQDEIISTSGLDQYPEVGQRISCYQYPRNDDLPLYTFGVQSLENWYGVGLNPSTDELIVTKDLFSSDQRASVSISNDTWYDVEAEWTSSGITARVFDVDQSTGDRQGSALASVTFSDSSYSSGGIGFRDASTGGSSRYDDYRILESI